MQVYGGARTQKGPFQVVHLLNSQGTRYKIDHTHQRALQSELVKGGALIEKWIRDKQNPATAPATAPATVTATATATASASSAIATDPATAPRLNFKPAEVEIYIMTTQDTSVDAPQCKGWAAQGGCTKARDSMLRACPKSFPTVCNAQALKAHLPEDGHDWKCTRWTNSGACTTNREYMLKTCPGSCPATI